MATTHGPFAYASGTTGDVDRFIYDGPLQTAASLPAASNTARNLCWAENRTPARSTGIGPDVGQAGGASEGFLYTECSSPAAANDVYTVEFDTVLDFSAEQWQLTFYYMQRAVAIGNNQSLLQIEIEENNSGTWIDVSGELGGSGNDVTTLDWGTEHSIDLSSGGTYVHAITRVRFRFETVAATVWHGDQAIDTVEIVGTDLAASEQDDFRFEDDDGSESGSTFLEAQNVDLTRAKETPFRLRQGVQHTGDPAAQSVTLQYKENGDAATEWRDVP